MTNWRDWPISQIKSRDAGFPKRLSKIKNPVKKLYYRGDWNVGLLDECLAVVGSRRNTKYGQQVIKMLIPGIVSEKITIVSGFMYGIDSLAHLETIDCGGKTIAVLGSGLDILYPTRNDDLYQKILESGGLVMSEYSPDTKPGLWTFPQRNRIVVGLSGLGVLVIEAGLGSGSLVTARIAKEEKRKVYCVPGPINSKVSAGCNLWIKNKKAVMVTGTEEIIGKKRKVNRQSLLFDGKGETEKQILKNLANEPFTLDELANNHKN